MARRDRREQRDQHALDDHGGVLCNPRDVEAAHRADVGGLVTAPPAAVTCKRCLELLRRATR